MSTVLQASMVPHEPAAREAVVSPTVLICAPDPLADDLVRTVLWSDGLTRHLATSLTAGLIYVVAARPHMVVVDTSLPDAEGLVRCLRHDPAAHSIAISALSRGSSRAYLGLLVAGADAVFTLPMSVEAQQRLARLLWAAVAQRESTRRP